MEKRNIACIDWELITEGLKSAKSATDAWQRTVCSVYDSLSEVYNLDKEQFFAACNTVDYRR